MGKIFNKLFKKVHSFTIRSITMIRMKKMMKFKSNNRQTIARFTTKSTNTKHNKFNRIMKDSKDNN